jgi:hypothetical protein
MSGIRTFGIAAPLAISTDGASEEALMVELVSEQLRKEERERRKGIRDELTVTAIEDEPAEPEGDAPVIDEPRGDYIERVQGWLWGRDAAHENELIKGATLKSYPVFLEVACGVCALLRRNQNFARYIASGVDAAFDAYRGRRLKQLEQRRPRDARNPADAQADAAAMRAKILAEIAERVREGDLSLLSEVDFNGDGYIQCTHMMDAAGLHLKAIAGAPSLAATRWGSLVAVFRADTRLATQVGLWKASCADLGELAERTVGKDRKQQAKAAWTARCNAVEAFDRAVEQLIEKATAKWAGQRGAEMHLGDLPGLELDEDAPVGPVQPDAEAEAPDVANDVEPALSDGEVLIDTDVVQALALDAVADQLGRRLEDGALPAEKAARKRAKREAEPGEFDPFDSPMRECDAPEAVKLGVMKPDDMSRSEWKARKPPRDVCLDCPPFGSESFGQACEKWLAYMEEMAEITEMLESSQPDLVARVWSIKQMQLQAANLLDGGGLTAAAMEHRREFWRQFVKHFKMNVVWGIANIFSPWSCDLKNAGDSVAFPPQTFYRTRVIAPLRAACEERSLRSARTPAVPARPPMPVPEPKPGDRFLARIHAAAPQAPAETEATLSQELEEYLTRHELQPRPDEDPLIEPGPLDKAKARLRQPLDPDWRGRAGDFWLSDGQRCYKKLAQVALSFVFRGTSSCATERYFSRLKKLYGPQARRMTTRMLAARLLLTMTAQAALDVLAGPGIFRSKKTVDAERRDERIAAGNNLIRYGVF